MSTRCHNLPMKNLSALRALVLVTTFGAFLTGCSLFNDGPRWGSKREAEKGPAVPALPEPVPTHRFEIDATTDVVGVVQKTSATKDDTLTDIARRFNVGYEEIVRANPGVDPWLPGAGREIVVPSRFVLPDTPPDGGALILVALPSLSSPPGGAADPHPVSAPAIAIAKAAGAPP